jgi:glutamate N-acetyltransferase / amino-acid N-acetyltransferase
MNLKRYAILPLGFQANGITAGIKKSGKADLALFYSELPALTSCRFTTNKILAAPVQFDKLRLKKNKSFRAIIANSGNANCFTGEAGLKDCLKSAQILSQCLGVSKDEILVASTGIIGKRLPIEKIVKAVPELVSGLSLKGIDKAEAAIRTTDTFAKKVSVRFAIDKKTVTICGVAKGAGMIAPDMATLLAFIFTDAKIAQKAMDKALTKAVDDSFNSITVDGCMSTNDSVMLLANKACGNSLIKDGADFNLFRKALSIVCLELAKMIVRDAEGASKFIEINVGGAKSAKDAKKAAFSIANSALFKTAMFASSKNILGRIAASVGASGADLEEKNLKIRYTPLHKKDVIINVSIGKGKSNAVIFTSDLTYKYVKINAAYN